MRVYLHNNDLEYCIKWTKAFREIKFGKENLMEVKENGILIGKVAEYCFEYYLKEYFWGRYEVWPDIIARNAHDIFDYRINGRLYDVKGTASYITAKINNDKREKCLINNVSRIIVGIVHKDFHYVDYPGFGQIQDFVPDNSQTFNQNQNRKIDMWILPVEKIKPLPEKDATIVPFEAEKREPVVVDDTVYKLTFEKMKKLCYT